MRRPSKPSVRSVSAALAPAKLAPTMTYVCSPLIGGPRRQGHELLPCASVVSDQAAESRRHGAGAQLLDTAQRHAQVLRLQNHAHPLGRQLVVEPAGDLCGQALLELEVAREVLDHATELAESDEPLGREVPDVGHAVK